MLRRAHLVLDAQSLRVYRENSPHVALSYIIVPKQGKSDPEELRACLAEIKQFGQGQCFLFENLGNNIVTIIPALGSGPTVSVYQKLCSITSLFFGKSILRNLDPATPQTLETPPSKSLKSVRFPELHIWTESKKLARNMAKSVFAFLERRGALKWTAASTPWLEKINSLIALDDIHKPKGSSCVFCKGDIIKKQLIIDFGSILVLYNIRPFPGTNAHFLLLPTRHIEDWFELNPAEQSALTIIKTGLMQSTETNYGISPKDIVTNIQNGVHAGQTVPHTHQRLKKPQAPENRLWQPCQCLVTQPLLD